MDELGEYHQNLMADIRREADSSGIMMVEAFFDRMTERLTESGELDNADRAFYASGEGGQKLRVDGYAGDPRDNEGVLGLIICDFVESAEVESFDKSGLVRLLNPLIRFLKEARSETFRDGLNDTSAAFQVSDLIISTWSSVTKVKLVAISNRRFVGRSDAVHLGNVGDVPVTFSVWDLSRFERFDRFGQARQDMVIDFAGEFGAPLPALKASQADAALESYLLIVPGLQLARIYDRWGSRLLESNVRTFLQARAKTNKGIQMTIRDTPELFFPYNNGLSATADSVTCEQTAAGLAISEIQNLQIVNGAQTTGSIHAGLKAMKDKLAQVFVQMKLTIVPPEIGEEVVPKISEYANTQNKVNAADFFSNHPFHIRMEQFSREILFTAKEGQRHDSKWFYERARGQYLNARNKLTPAQQRSFDIEYPKAQLFSKTDLAKFEFSARGRPDLVSKGAQKNFAEFAKDVGEAWSKQEAKFDDLWFRRLISKALIFRRLESEVPKQPWYEGGYRANVVTYAMAKVFVDADRGKEVLDLDTIWRRQEVPEPLNRALLIAAEAAHDAITDPPAGVRNMSEWAKQQACWAGLKSRKLTYDDDFDRCLALADEARTAEREARANKELNARVTAEIEVVNRGSDYWRRVLDWGQRQRLLSPKEAQILEICSSIPRRLPTDFQSKQAMVVLDRLTQQGMPDFLDEPTT